MNKIEFLNKIKENSGDLPEDEQEQLISFYSEMLDDMVENGFSEEEATDQLTKNNFSTPDKKSEMDNEPVTDSSCGETTSGDEERILYVCSDSPDIFIKSSSDGDFHIEYDSEKCSVQKDDMGNMLRISVSSNRIHHSSETGIIGFMRRFSVRVDSVPPVVLYLPKDIFHSCYIDSGSGDADIDYPFDHIIRITSNSGDIKVQAASDLQTLDLNSKSGDMDIISPLIKSDSITLCTISGDILFRREAGTGKMKAKTVSGDMRFFAIEAAEAELYTTSGDLICNKVEISQQLTMKSVSGDIQAKSFSSPMSKLSAVSGDVIVTLSCPTSCTLKSTSGDIKAQLKEDASNILEITTISGDIIVS